MRAKFKIGQIAVLKDSDGKLPVRINAKDFRYGTTWYYEISFGPGHYNECVLRKQTRRERGGGL